MYKREMAIIRGYARQLFDAAHERLRQAKCEHDAAAAREDMHNAGEIVKSVDKCDFQRQVDEHELSQLPSESVQVPDDLPKNTENLGR